MYMFTPTIFRQKQDKARLTEKAILLVEEKGWDIQKAFHRYGLKINPFSYPRILTRYQKGGWQNLVDTRGGNRHPKVTPPVLDFIRQTKRQNPTQSAKEITLLLEERFQIRLHSLYIGNLLRKLSLANARGRRPNPKTLPIHHIDHAGSFFLKGICLKMGIIETISSTIMAKIAALQESRSQQNLNILQRPSGVIKVKLETLLYMPLSRTVYFLNDFYGHPILSLTQPGDSHLTQVLFPLMSQLEEALGKEVIKIAIFDREGLAVWVLQEMTKQGRRFITFLRDNQYESEDDFDISPAQHNTSPCAKRMVGSPN